MRSFIASLFAIAVAAAPSLRGRQIVTPASIPQLASDPIARAQGVAVKFEGYQYAPSLIGNSSFHLGGPLGKFRVQSDVAAWTVDRRIMNQSTEVDLAAASAAITINQGLRSLDDYARVLYSGQWETSVPGGVASGMLSNYTQDLLFSMERLSLNPYPLRRLQPKDPLPFQLSVNISLPLTGLSLEALMATGNLFVVDHSYQAKYKKTAKFGAFCTAYFFIHPKSGDFLPLAIKTNTGSDLTYTPLDTANDWLLAKMMFNVNDLFHSQMYHVVASHAIGEAVHEAALRTLSDDHPIFLILDRLMMQAYAIRVIGDAALFNPGGGFDTSFHISGEGGRQYATDFYPILGSYTGGYLKADLKSRNLIDPPIGSSFKSFPFYEEVLPLQTTIRKFFTKCVDSYYDSDAVITADIELQAWFAEGTDGAKVIGFPACESVNKKTLIDVLTHLAYLTGVAHHVLNTGDPVHTSATLPFHPAGLWAPLPTTKGVTDVLPFLPPPRAALAHIATFAFFNRAHFEARNWTLVHAFDEEALLGRLNKKSVDAAKAFKQEMMAFSGRVRGKKFDADGLCQGMPFIWKGLDPGPIPFFFAV